MLLNRKTFVAYIIQYFEYLYDKMAVTYILNHPVYTSAAKYNFLFDLRTAEKLMRCARLIRYIRPAVSISFWIFETQPPPTSLRVGKSVVGAKNYDL